MNKHTPGPWRWRMDRIFGAKNQTIADIRFREDTPEQYANAALIRAAPDLLLACELVKGWMELENIKPGPVVWIELCRAIALAKEERR